MMPSLKTPYATITPYEMDGTTVFSLSVGWEDSHLEIRNEPPVYHAASPVAARAAADEIIAADWPRTGDWEAVEVTAFYGLPKVTGWRAPVDPVGERRAAEMLAPEKFNLPGDI